MTTEEFYTALARKTKRQQTVWGLVISGAIRTKPYGFDCPLSFVAKGSVEDPFSAGASLNLRPQAVKNLVRAADGAGEWSRPDIRVRLLQACGLEAK